MSSGQTHLKKVELGQNSTEELVLLITLLIFELSIFLEGRF
jgi:hypothetical protein